MIHVRAVRAKSIKSVMESKARISILIPYRKKGNEVLVYLQKRSDDAVRLPGYFGFFGGHAEGEENPDEALRREIKEELNFSLEKYEALGKYEFPWSVKHAFTLEVNDSFEKEIEVLEGDYGQYFTREEALNEQKIIEEDKIILREFYGEYLK